MRYARFKNSFIFKYSVRPGNEASRIYEDDVPEIVKKRRNNELLAVQNEISAELNRSFLGREVEILVEGPSKREAKSVAQEESLYAENEQPIETSVETSSAPSNLTSLSDLIATAAPSGTVQLTGRTPCDRIVVFNGLPELAGTFQRVKIVETAPFTLFGEIITK